MNGDGGGDDGSSSEPYHSVNCTIRSNFAFKNCPHDEAEEREKHISKMPSHMSDWNTSETFSLQKNEKSAESERTNGDFLFLFSVD